MTTDETTTAKELFEAARDDPSSVDPADLHPLLGADRSTARRFALDAASLLATRNPEAVHEEFGDDLETLESLAADADPAVRASAATLVGRLGAVDPDVVSSLRPSFSSLLADDVPIVRTKALEALDGFSYRHPAAARPFVDDVVPTLENEDEAALGAALGVLARVATADPAAVVDSLPRLLELLAEGTGYDSERSGAARVRRAGTTAAHRSTALSDHRSVRQLAGHAVSQVAAADPDRVAPAADDLASLLDDPDAQVQAVAADALVALVEDRPDAVEPRLGALRDRLDADAEYVRARCVQALAGLGGSRGDDVAAAALKHAGRVRDLLEHEEPPVRGSAATLLALAGERDPDAVGPAADRLRALRDGDEPEYVRAAAVDALAALE